MILKKKISVIIPTLNGEKTIEGCVRSVVGQSLPPYEIIVVDNASIDTTFEKIKNLKLKNQKYKLKIIRNVKNLGVTGGRNVGIKSAKHYDYLFFFDHDMLADKKLLEELLKVAESRENIGIVTPKIYYLEDKKFIWSAGTAVNLWTGQVIFRNGPDTGQFDRVEEVQVAPAAMLVKKKLVDKIGGFDEKIFAVWEDTDFSFRAREKGYKVIYAPEAIAYHNLSRKKEDEAKRLLRRAYWVGRNRILFMKRYGNSFPVFLLFWPIYVIYYFILSVKYKNFKGYYNFLKGSVNGLVGI